jgi:uncharacterized protein
MLLFNAARLLRQRSLYDWHPNSEAETWLRSAVETLNMPNNISWETIKRVYEFQPKNYEELLGVRGVGPTTVRGLALIAELVYGEKPSWVDPVRFSFAYGGKDGVPFPVDRKAMDEYLQVLRQAVEPAKIGDIEKNALIAGA